jgi:hypothetical protein
LCVRISLLGYGKVNAQGFNNRANLSIHIHEATLPPLEEKLGELTSKSLLFVRGYARSKFQPASASPSSDVSFLSQELNKITERHKSFELDKSDFLLDNVQSPIFSAVLEDEETKKLYQEYSETRKIIQEAYKDKPMFEVTINQWMKN